MISVRMRRPTGNIRSAHLDPPFFGIDDAHRAADCRGHTQTSDPSGLNCANRGRVSTNTLEVISWVSVSMKWAMLVVSDVATTVLPSGLTPMPSGSTTGIWRAAGRKSTAIYANSNQDRQKVLTSRARVITTSSKFAVEYPMQFGKLPEGRNPFGFKDGLRNPHVEATRSIASQQRSID